MTRPNRPLLLLPVSLALLSLSTGCWLVRTPVTARQLVPVADPTGALRPDDNNALEPKLVELTVPELEPPRTPLEPEAERLEELTLHAAIRHALQNSAVVRVSVGTTVRPSGSTRYDQAITETQVQVSESVFDPQFLVRMFWNRTDEPTGVTFGPGIPVPNERDTANFAASITKRLVTGGTASVQFLTGYLFFPRGGLFRSLNPQYTTNVEFAVSQPLLRGGGIEFNRAPIVIARIRSDQSYWQWRQSVLALVRSVEEAYWNLYAAHVALRAIEQVLPLAAEVVRVEQARLETGQAIPADVAQAEANLALFRQQRLRALANVLNQEAQLRNLLGLPPNDDRRLIPAELPPEAPVQLDWVAAIEAAVEHRPDIARQRLAVRLSELQITIAQNALQPQLDLQALWRINGLADRLDDSIDVLTDNQFTDWQLGFTFSFPFGYREAAARLRQAKLQFRREVALLNEAVHQATHEIANLMREAETVYGEYLAARQRQEAAARWVDGARARFENPVAPAPGAQSAYLIALQVYLQALQSWANATSEAARLLAQYHITLARLEEAKGTLLELYNIHDQQEPDLLF